MSELNTLVSEFSTEKSLKDAAAKNAYLEQAVKNATFVKANHTTAYRNSFEVLDRAEKIHTIKEDKLSKFEKLLLLISMSTYTEKDFEKFQKKVYPNEKPLTRRDFYRQLCIRNNSYTGEKIENDFVDMVYDTSNDLIKEIETRTLPTVADFLAAAQKERMFADPTLITQRMTRAEWKQRGFSISKSAIGSGKTEEGEPLFDSVWACPKSKKCQKDYIEIPLITSRKTSYTLFDPEKHECDCPNFENVIERLEEAFHVKINILHPETKVNAKVEKRLKSSLKKGKESFWFPKTRQYAPQLCVYGLRLNKANYADVKTSNIEGKENYVELNKNDLAAVTVYEIAKGLFASDYNKIKKRVKKSFKMNSTFWKRHGKNNYFNQFMTFNEASCLLATQMVMRALPLDDNNVKASRKLDQGLGFAFANKMAQFRDLSAQWVLPAIKETAMDMAYNFYKSLKITPAQLRDNCSKLGYTVPKEAKSDLSVVSKDDYAEMIFPARSFEKFKERDVVYNWLNDEEETIDSLLQGTMGSLPGLRGLGVQRRVVEPTQVEAVDEVEEKEQVVEKEEPAQVKKEEEVKQEVVEPAVTVAEEEAVRQDVVEEQEEVGSLDFDEFIYAKLKNDLKEVLDEEKITQEDSKAQSYYRIFETVREKTALKGLIIRIIGKDDYEKEYNQYLKDIEEINLLRESPRTGKTRHEIKRDEALAKIAERDRKLAEEKSPIIYIPYTNPLRLPAPQERLAVNSDKLLLTSSKYVEDLVEIADLRGDIENKILDLSILKICKETIDNMKKTNREPEFKTVADVVIKSINIDNINHDFDSNAITFVALKKLAYTSDRSELDAYVSTLADGLTRLDVDKVIASLEAEIDSLKSQRLSLMTGINQTILDNDLIVEGKLVTLLNTEYSYDCTCKQWFKDGKVFDKEKCNAILTEVDEKIVDDTRKTVNSIKIEFNKSTKTLEEQFEIMKKKIFADLVKKVNVAVSEIGLQANKKLINATKKTNVNELTALKDLAYSIYIRRTGPDKKVASGVLNPSYDGTTVKNYTAIVESYKEQAIQDVDAITLKLFGEIIADMQENPDNYRKVDAANNVKLLTPTTIINKYFGGVAARKDGIRDLISDGVSKYATSLANLKNIADKMKISVDELSRNMAKSESYTEVIAEKLSVDKTEVETKVKLIQKDDGGQGK